MVNKVHIRKLKWVEALSKKMNGDVTWFTILKDSDGLSDRIFCHICRDSIGRKVTETISSFSKKHCNNEHREQFKNWKEEHPFHSFQKKILTTQKGY